jgi:hypothetical protein
MEKERLKREGRDFVEAIDVINRRYFGRYDALLDACSLRFLLPQK